MTNNVTAETLSTITKLLEHYPSGMSEIALLRLLQERHPELPVGNRTGDSLSLFQSHFLLFHYLYRIQRQLWEQQSGHLQISPLCIQLLPYQPGRFDVAESDPLRDYYLDPTNLESTSKADVDHMLADFWKRYLSPAGRAEALSALGLADPVDDEAIKRRYRKLAMEHHPDRGGNTEDLQAIHAAIRMLLPRDSR
jgi:DnaJ-domain-containing protein 1